MLNARAAHLRLKEDSSHLRFQPAQKTPVFRIASPSYNYTKQLRSFSSTHEANQNKLNEKINQIVAEFKNIVTPIMSRSSTIISDIHELIDIRMQREFVRRRDYQKYIEIKEDLARAAPPMLFFFLPIIGNLVPIIIYFYPAFLPRRFLVEKVGIETEKKALKSSISQILKGLEERNLSCINELVKKARFGDHVKNDEIALCAPEFNNFLSLSELSHKELSTMSRFLFLPQIYHYMPSFIQARRISKKVSNMRVLDRMILMEGVESMPDQELKEACLDRGIISVEDSIEKGKEGLNEWVQFSTQSFVTSSYYVFALALKNNYLSK